MEVRQWGGIGGRPVNFTGVVSRRPLFLDQFSQKEMSEYMTEFPERFDLGRGGGGLGPPGEVSNGEFHHTVGGGSKVTKIYCQNEEFSIRYCPNTPVDYLKRTQ